MVLEIYCFENYSIFENRKPIMLELRTAEQVGKNYKTCKEQNFSLIKKIHNTKQNCKIYIRLDFIKKIYIAKCC